MNRSTLHTYSLYGFYTCSIIHLFEQIVQTGWLNMATKPLLMILLLVHYLTSPNSKSTTLTKLVVAALSLSWLGDILLMLQAQAEGLFIFGLSAFLSAHLCYIFAYRQARFQTATKKFTSYIRGRTVFLILVGGVLIFMLYPTLDDMLAPVIMYTVVIIFMGITALRRRGYTSEKSFIMVYSGALLFIMSDAMIGIDRFMSPVFHARLLIMATYIAAQFLIVKGLMVHESLTMEERG